MTESKNINKFNFWFYLYLGVAFLFWENLLGSFQGLYHFEFRRSVAMIVYYGLLFLVLGGASEIINGAFRRLMPRWYWPGQRYLWFTCFLVLILWGKLQQKVVFVLTGYRNLTVLNIFWILAVFLTGVLLSRFIVRKRKQVEVSFPSKRFLLFFPLVLLFVLSSTKIMIHNFRIFSGRDLPLMFAIMVVLLVVTFVVVFIINRFGKSHSALLRSYLLIPLALTILTILISSLAGKAGYEPVENFAAGSSDNRPNFVVMVFDALRADHVGAISDKYDLTPMMDKLASEGRVYNKCYATGSWTFPSTVSILTSRLPNKLGLLVRNHIPGGVVAFPSILRDNGYYTAGLSTNTYFHPREGFQHFFVNFKLYLGNIHRQLLLPFDSFFQNLPHLNELAYQLDCISTDYYAGSWKQVNQGAYKLLQNTENRPFLLYLHYMETHVPYRAKPFNDGFLDMTSLARPSLPAPPFEAYKHEADSDIAGLLRLQHNRYKDCVKAADEAVADMLDLLQSMGISDRTILILTSDHGEEFYEHKAWAHGISLFDVQIHIPLIFHIPAGLDLALPEQAVSTTSLDIGPTILDLAGIEEKIPDSDGWSLMQSYPASKRPIYAILATEKNLVSSVILDPYKLIMIENEMTGKIDTLLYNLKNDPSESINIFAENRVLGDSLAVLVQVQLDQSVEPPERKKRRLSPQELQRLRALGYID